MSGRWISVATVAAIGLGLLALAMGGLPRPADLSALWAPSGSKSTGPGGPAAKGTGAAPPRAIAVEATKAALMRVSSDVRAIGTLQSDESVRLAPEIAGRIEEITFAEGQPVKRGDPIIKLDDTIARGELAQAKARLALAEANNQRTRALSRTGNVTERAGDEARATYETAQAETELAEARLSKHLLRAPFDGVAGVRNISVGAYVSAGTAIVNLEKIDRLKVDFRVPERFLGDVAVGQKIEVTVDAAPGRAFEGEIYAINPLVDVNGRALEIRAVLPNAGLALRPGLFARILVRGITEREIVTLPEAALLPRGGETLVYRIDEGRVIETRVKLGERREGIVEITEGLAAGAVVVTAGQQKLSDGAAVEIVKLGGPEARPDGAPRASRSGSSG
jgi:membrane fusion protein (multidrug efflux system)